VKLAIKSKLLAGVLATASVVLAGVAFGNSRFNPVPQLLAEVDSTAYSHPKFPEIDPATLTPRQQKLIALIKQEYDTQPRGTKYSDGIREPWCADFVSWVYKEAGEPYSNPHSGSWRIPGTVTLREYYQANGRFKPADSGYTPQVGDIMLYDRPSRFGQHVNFVVKNDAGVITTVGGNERGGIRVNVHTDPESSGFLGYGT
jgi:hypothetical protein